MWYHFVLAVRQGHELLPQTLDEDVFDLLTKPFRNNEKQVERALG